MGAYDETFEWVDLPEGRARFSGGGRAWDEKVHDIFGVDVEGREYFGEIRPAFLPNNNDYNIEVLSFGYGSNTSVGMPMLESCQTFTMAQATIVEALVTQLIDAGTRFVDRPPVLAEFPHAHFMGKVIFRDGWVIRTSESAS